ncbi:MAG: hypothetical protein ABJB76_00280, partial [Candidatus Nitrosocosmicus sp.]
MSNELILTPGGFRSKSLVHLIESGHMLRMTDNHIQKVHSSGKVLIDFGEINRRPGNEPLMPSNVNIGPKNIPSFGSGWITYAYWNNNTGTPISSFTTSWIVPPLPSTQSGQTIFFFNGIQNSTYIYQPVLQWGQSAAGGGDYWSVASWYVDSSTGPAFHSSLVRVNPGDTLIGIMTLSSQNGASFNYNCVFQGITDSSLPVQNIQELTWCAETLEAYGITNCLDYPSISKTVMSTINIQTGNTHPNIAWTPNNSVTDCGQHTVVVSNSASAGEVDLFYHYLNSSGLWISWKGDGNDNLNVMDIFNPSSKIISNETSPTSPAITAFNNS